MSTCTTIIGSCARKTKAESQIKLIFSGTIKQKTAQRARFQKSYNKTLKTITKCRGFFFLRFRANSSDQPTEGIPPNGGDCKGMPPKVPEAFRFWNFGNIPRNREASLLN